MTVTTDTELLTTVVREIGVFLETDTSHLRPDSSLTAELDNMNSLKLYEMMLYLEDAIGFSFDEKVVDRLDTVQDLVDYIRERLR
ncbi:MAG: acyl carrier protein [Telmatospirillum sp.]|nr:acyl carrier protein [Telmatospirillum sp.]